MNATIQKRGVCFGQTVANTVCFHIRSAVIPSRKVYHKNHKERETHFPFSSLSVRDHSSDRDIMAQNKHTKRPFLLRSQLTLLDAPQSERHQSHRNEIKQIIFRQDISTSHTNSGTLAKELSNDLFSTASFSRKRTELQARTRRSH